MHKKDFKKGEQVTAATWVLNIKSVVSSKQNERNMSRINP